MVALRTWLAAADLHDGPVFRKVSTGNRVLDRALHPESVNNLVRAAVARAGRGESELEAEIAKLLGKPWDDELEPFRYAGEGAPVRWLHQVV